MGAAWALIVETYEEWTRDSVPRLAAALSYYTLFSLAPLLLMLVSVAGLFAQRGEVEAGLLQQAQAILGSTGAAAVQALIKASASSSGGLASILAFLAMAWGALSFFGQLQESFNLIWGVELRPDLDWKVSVGRRLYCFFLVVLGGVLLLASQIATAVLSALTLYLHSYLSGPPWAWQVLNFAVGVALTSLLFALAFWVLPDVEVHWADVKVGALLTGLLFSLGQLGLGFYLGGVGFTSTYGAAASFIVLLLWCNYSAQILFFGVEFTKVWARHCGRAVIPRGHARLRPDFKET